MARLGAGILAAVAACGCAGRAGDGHTGVLPREMEGLRFESLTRVTYSRAGEDLDPAVVRAPQGDPAGFFVYYASTQNAAEPDLFRKPRDGDLAVEQLTTHEAADRFPRPRPGDPNQIAFASNRRGSWDIWLLQLRAGAPPEEILLTQDPGDEIDPAWSPDGQYVVFASLGARDRRWGLRILHLATRALTALPTDGFLPDWNPDANDGRLAFQRARERPAPEEPWYGIWTTTSVGNLLTQIVSSPDWAAISPSWSPDGAWIAFASVSKSDVARREGRWGRGDDIWVVRSDGTGLTQLTWDPAADWGPAWGADGLIYFTSRRGGDQPNLWSVKPILPAR